MIEYFNQLPQEEQEQLRDLIRKLFRQTYILEQKYDRHEARLLVNKEYYFCEKHMEFLKAWFSVAGMGLEENSGLGVIFLQGADNLGEKLPMLSTIYILLLKLIYDEQMAAASTSVNIVTTLGYLNGKAGEFGLVKSVSSVSEMRRALAVLRRYQMIELPDPMEELNENTRILIYPCINVVLMREDITGLLESFAEEKQDVKETHKDGESEAGV